MSIIEENAKTIKDWLKHLDFEHEHPGYSVESMSGSRFPIMDPQTTYTMSAFVWQIFIFCK